MTTEPSQQTDRLQAIRAIGYEISGNDIDWFLEVIAAADELAKAAEDFRWRPIGSTTEEWAEVADRIQRLYEACTTYRRTREGTE